jgi:4-carboxymuconolactone decarboxylase
MDDRERHAKGMAARRAVLGDAHVDRAQTREFTKDFNDLVTRYAWGEIWTRPGLPRPTRSLVTLAMLIALRQHDELRLHARAALRNGVTPEELNELLLHAVIYCGAPAAHSAYGIIEEILAEAPSSG